MKRLLFFLFLLPMIAQAEVIRFTSDAISEGAQFEQELAEAKAEGATIELELKDPALIEAYRERLFAVIPKYVDVLIASDEGAYALTHLPQEEATPFLKNFCSSIKDSSGSEKNRLQSN